MRPFKASNIVLGLLCVMYFITYVDRVNLGAAADSIQTEFELTNLQLGWLLSAFAYPYLILQVAGTWVGDHYGPRRVLVVCGLIWAGATMFTGLAWSFWSLIVIVSLKYLTFILRADNDGEGGVIALMALATPNRARHNWQRRALIGLGLFGASLLYGDGMITPAISVLSAVEGLEVATPVLAPFVVPVAVVILVLLFLVQRHGTGAVGAVFGPVTLLWFLVIAAIGARCPCCGRAPSSTRPPSCATPRPRTFSEP